MYIHIYLYTNTHTYAYTNTQPALPDGVMSTYKECATNYGTMAFRTIVGLFCHMIRPLLPYD